MSLDELLQPRRQRILLVDDEEDIRESLRDILEASIPDVEVEAAADGEAGLALMDAQTFDLIVSDYKMPGLNGIDFLLEASRRAPAVPKVLMTAFPDLEIALQAINEAKITNFFTKPLEPAKIIATLKELLEHRAQETRRARAMARSLAMTKGASNQD